MAELAPVRHIHPNNKPWEGSISKKPWDYTVTVGIPHIDTPDQLYWVVELLRAQTEKPYIVIVDTGSLPDNLEKVVQMRADDLEVHSIAMNGYLHCADAPAMAMDLVTATCRTDYICATHTDVFLRSPYVLEEMLELTKMWDICGYEITPRKWSNWKWMLSHSLSMYKTELFERYGVSWNLRRLAKLMGLKDQRPSMQRPDWPDGELGVGYQIRNLDMVPLVIGTEKSYIQTIDQRMWHCRTMTGGVLFDPDGWGKASVGYTKDAIDEAKIHLDSWQKNPPAKAKSIHIVVHRYNENIEWNRDIQHPFTTFDSGGFLYRKDGEKRALSTLYTHGLENVGREAHGYLTFLSWGKYCDVMAFLQANPINHSKDPVPKWLKTHAGYKDIGDVMYVCNRDGSPQSEYRLPIDDVWNRLKEIEPTLGDLPEQLQFYAGACFAIDRETASRFTTGQYKQMIQILHEEPLAPWCFERLWPYLFGTK